MIIIYINDERKFIKAGYDFNKYQKELNMVINNSFGVRDRVVNIARYMAICFFKLPYFWGGGHHQSYFYMQGLDQEWGMRMPILDGGSCNFKVGGYYPKSLDCSGFVMWCLINGGYDTFKYARDGVSLNSSDLYKMGKHYDINDKNILKIVKNGDFAYMKGHIGIIVFVDELNESISVAHISFSGEGMNLTTISTKSGLVIEDDLGEMINSSYKNRILKPYFTEIVSIKYDD